MHLGRPINLAPNKSGQLGLLALCAAAFLSFIWWIFAMIRKAKSVAAHGSKRN
jgi:hypothetical protein